MRAYLISRCHGLATHLLSARAIQDIAYSRSLSEFRDVLTPTDYGARLMRVERINQVEKALSRVFIERMNYLLEISSGGDKDFLEAYLRRIELQNIMRILRKIVIKVEKAEILDELMPIRIPEAVSLSDLANSRSIDEALSKLEGTIYEGSAKLRGEKLIIIEAALRKAYYEEVLRKLRKIPLTDGKRIEELISLEIDLSNAAASTLPPAHGYNVEVAEKLMLESPRGLKLKRFIEASRSPSIEELLNKLPEYSDFIRGLLEGIELDVMLLRSLWRRVYAQRIQTYNNFFYVIRYILACEIEYRDLRAIAFSIHHQIPLEDRFKLLISAGVTEA